MIEINKRGGITVFLTSILVTMIIASMVFVHASRSIGSASYTDAVLELAGRSALSEFDRRLKDEYGIFAFYGYEDMVASNINFYASASFNKALPSEHLFGFRTATDLYRLQLQKIDVNLASYSLMDVNVFEEQISNYMNYFIAHKGIEYIRNMQKSNVPNISTSGEEGSESANSGRELKNKAEIESLPSRTSNVSNVNIATILESRTPSVGEIFDESVLTVKINEYLLSHFNNAMRQDRTKDTFFRNEIEYILYGNLSDRSNLSRFRLEFVILRTVLNVIHIKNDEDKMRMVDTVASAAGAKKWVVGLAIIAVWGAAEAENDARLLLAGKNVDLFKSKDTWALDFRNALTTRRVRDEDGNVVDVVARERRRTGYITPRSSEGLSYMEYLRMFLYVQRRETKLTRAMDLIQLNFRGSYYEEFLIKDHYTGFSLNAVVSGKKFEYEQKY